MLGTSSAPSIFSMDARDPARLRRKRKADSHDFSDRERLSKRLSRLNIEPSGPRLYVPVEAPANAAAAATSSLPSSSSSSSSKLADETMQLDDSKHKVYIYDLDAELSSDSDNDEGKLIFLPDIEKHLRESRIPRGVLANDEGQLAGMQLVLYSDPKSLSVPEERDGVRRAIIEARQRAREAQAQKNGGTYSTNGTASPAASQAVSQTTPHTYPPMNPPAFAQPIPEPIPHIDPAPPQPFPVDDADAMEVD
ncbi:hypothetical protein M419DRAFT_25410 [Trichoderma reesei RUT C-30]|uniref:Uncharacterized protein n=1 Tax=Hypocrea jecorina (strain ATCC 56765 / BCRC 32924 / NRRL 11460 / Rut C-30) TaxID=1344414 RepID=A0A024S772_HYPJR|nr:hypothetical protein M419DRAFT_25410 [Trichoderma reesei RUT C-30]